MDDTIKIFFHSSCIDLSSILKPSKLQLQNKHKLQKQNNTTLWYVDSESENSSKVL